MTRQEGDEVAQMVLDLVEALVKPRVGWTPPAGLERNVRPEPPEAKLGYMPRRVA